MLDTVENYHKYKCAWFFSSKDPNFELSNMASGIPITFQDKEWHSSEQLYQASKYFSDTTCLPEDAKEGVQPLVRQRIFESKTPMASKITQKCAVEASLVRNDWDIAMVHNMLFVIQLKFYYNPETFGEVLCATEGQDIVEISRYDAFWGCKPVSGVFLKGQNVLGKLLMQVREDAVNIAHGHFDKPFNFMLP